ncbi:MAG: ferrous iron transport protein B [Lentisphaerae bacterium]|nr:ferrous iron transport protein B [Lentisphaerota bacterium]
MKTSLTIALAGNPNSGKTTLFNNLTGSRQHVGNYPGVTVEKKEGFARHGQRELRIVDLPGIYSLTAYSIEEVVARNYILNERPDVIVDVIDCSNLERNLYLGVQLLELGIPVVFAMNMSDVAKERGLEFDMDKLSSMLGVPLVATVGHKNKGMSDLLEAAIVATSGGLGSKPVKVTYGKELEDSIAKLQELLGEGDGQLISWPDRWIAIKLLENDKEVLSAMGEQDALYDLVATEQAHIGKVLGDTAEMIIADRRYGFVSGACQGVVRSTAEVRRTRSDRIDEIVLHKFWGIPIFLGMMYLVFWLTFIVGTPPMDWIEAGFVWLGGAVTNFWAPGSESLLKSLVVDGLIAGVGGVIVFLPNILLLFLAIAVLEDSGYMARAAFMMDRLMNKIGLHGKSFIPMLTGFGCSIPGIMATRTLENKRDRLTTMLVLPLMSCGARLPIYALIIPAFFPDMWHAPMLWLIYVIGIVLAIASAKLLRSTLFKGESVPFVMELPPYRLPTLKGVLIHMWDKGGLYLKKAGTIILGISVLLWVLTSFPKLNEVDPSLNEEEQMMAELSHSVAGRIGHAMEPVIRPLGFDWRIGTAMIGAFAAKEVFVAQLGIVYAVGEADEESIPLRTKLRENYSPLAGFCIMLFMLISAPCMATIAVTRRESGSWKWAMFQLLGLTLLAYVITITVYQVGSWIGVGI